MVWLLGKNPPSDYVEPLPAVTKDTPHVRRLVEVWPLCQHIIGQYSRYTQEKQDLRSVGIASIWSNILRDADRNNITFRLHCDLSRYIRRERRHASLEFDLPAPQGSDRFDELAEYFCQSGREQFVFRKLFEGYRQNEIAEMLGLSESTISGIVDYWRNNFER